MDKFFGPFPKGLEAGVVAEGHQFFGPALDFLVDENLGNAPPFVHNRAFEGGQHVPEFLRGVVGQVFGTQKFQRCFRLHGMMVLAEGMGQVLGQSLDQPELGNGFLQVIVTAGHLHLVTLVGGGSRG